MANQALNFRKVSGIPSSNLEVGTVYFDNSTHCIAVAVSDSSAVYYSGVRDVTMDSSSIMHIVGPHGTTQEIDFSHLIIDTEFNKLMAAVGVTASGNEFVFDTDSEGIKGTNYLDSSFAHTVKGALTVLDSKLKAVEASAGVMSIGGQAGAITLLGGQDASGKVNLAMGTGDNDHRIEASIIGLDTAAYRPESYFDVSGAAEAVRGKTTDSSDASTVYGAKKKAEEILGTPSDTSAANTVYGAKQKAEDVKTELLGDATTDTSASKTIEGLTKKIEESNADSELHLYSGTEGTTPATEVTADGQTYRLVQGSGSTAATVATFNIEKDSFVTDGSVVYHSDASASAWGEPGTYIQLAIRTTNTSTGSSAEKIIYIPADSLVDTYTANNSGHNVTVTVSDYTISADVSVTAGTSQLSFTGTDTTIATAAGTEIKVKLDTLESVAASTAGGVQLSEANNTLSARLIDNAVTTAKIVDGNVTTEKLDSSVLAALEKANNSVQSVTGETAVANSSYIEISVEASTNASKDVTLSSHANVTTHDVSTATASANGLATAFDVQEYVKAYVAEQLVWKQFD